MGVGKTTVGRLLADQLRVRFVDLDAAIESASGRTVADIFADDGEARFRALEHTTLMQLLDGPPIVVALGGGTLHQKGNADLVSQRSDLLVLWAELSVIKARVGAADSSRPLWMDAERLFVEREPGYRSVGSLLETGNMSLEQVVGQMMEVIQCG